MYDLITEDDYGKLPDGPALKFARIEGICRKNLNEAVHRSDDAQFNDLMRTQYMSVVYESAKELGIAGVPEPDWEADPEREIKAFLRAALGATARARLGGAADAYSVRVSAKTLGKIELEIQSLRRCIDAADFPKSKKDALHSKLDELASELRNHRASFGKVLGTLAVVGAALAGVVAIAADAPEAYANIITLLGRDKEAEEVELERLGPPPTRQALPAPAAELDDEIPF